jgi:hypothetical protein
VANAGAGVTSRPDTISATHFLATQPIDRPLAREWQISAIWNGLLAIGYQLLASLADLPTCHLADFTLYDFCPTRVGGAGANFIGNSQSDVGTSVLTAVLDRDSPEVR